MSSYDFPGGAWNYVPAKQIFKVPPSMRTDFVLGLRERVAYEVPEAFRERLRVQGREAPEGLRLFVVRGCSFGPNPTFAVVRRTPDGSGLHVHQATIEPEMLLMSGDETVRPRPVIVALDAAPTSVIATADRGGDRALRGWREMKWLP